jgi:hypothetical protein
MADRQVPQAAAQVQGFAACRVTPPPRPTALALGRRQARRCLTAIDDCLDALECLHLRDRTSPSRSACRAVIQMLVSLGIEPPAAVRGASDTYALHEALLDWQEMVLENLLRLRRQPVQ